MAARARVAGASRRMTAGRAGVLRLRVPARWRGRRVRLEVSAVAAGVPVETVAQRIRVRR